MARAPVSKTGGWGFEVPPLLPASHQETDKVGQSRQVRGYRGGVTQIPAEIFRNVRECGVSKPGKSPRDVPWAASGPRSSRRTPSICSKSATAFEMTGCETASRSCETFTPSNPARGGRRCRFSGDNARCEGASLSDTAYHDGGAVSCRRGNGHARAYFVGAHEGIARSTHRHRGRWWCGRQHWRWTCRPNRTGRLHAQHRQCSNTCLQCCDPEASIRSCERLRTRIADRRHALLDRCEKYFAGEGPEGVQRLAKRPMISKIRCRLRHDTAAAHIGRAHDVLAHVGKRHRLDRIVEAGSGHRSLNFRLGPVINL